jgi:hypothetical protein
MIIERLRPFSIGNGETIKLLSPSEIRDEATPSR